MLARVLEDTLKAADGELGGAGEGRDGVERVDGGYERREAREHERREDVADALVVLVQLRERDPKRRRREWLAGRGRDRRPGAEEHARGRGRGGNDAERQQRRRRDRDGRDDDVRDVVPLVERPQSESQRRVVEDLDVREELGLEVVRGRTGRCRGEYRSAAVLPNCPTNDRARKKFFDNQKKTLTFGHQRLVDGDHALRYVDASIVTHDGVEDVDQVRIDRAEAVDGARHDEERVGAWDIASQEV